jgi:hypothetical protein
MKLLQDNEVKGLNAIATSLKTASILLEEINRCCRASLYNEFSKDIREAYDNCDLVHMALAEAMAEVKKMHRDNKEVERLWKRMEA